MPGSRGRLHQPLQRRADRELDISVAEMPATAAIQLQVCRDALEQDDALLPAPMLPAAVMTVSSCSSVSAIIYARRPM
jgi:hypothetical protein